MVFLKRNQELAQCFFEFDNRTYIHRTSVQLSLLDPYKTPVLEKILLLHIPLFLHTIIERKWQTLIISDGPLTPSTIQPSFIIAASDAFLPAILFSFTCEPTAGKYKSYNPFQSFHLFNLFEFSQELNRLIFRKLL